MENTGLCRSPRPSSVSVPTARVWCSSPFVTVTLGREDRNETGGEDAHISSLLAMPALLGGRLPAQAFLYPLSSSRPSSFGTSPFLGPFLDAWHFFIPG